MTELTIEEFQDGMSDGLNLPSKNPEGGEMQFFLVETDSPNALDEFLRLFGSHEGVTSFLLKSGDEFVVVDGAFVIRAEVNGPYIYQMVLQNKLCKNIRPLEVDDD